jgi:hypothetical protein
MQGVSEPEGDEGLTRSKRLNKLGMTDAGRRE